MRSPAYRSARKVFDELTQGDGGDGSIERDANAAQAALEICPEYVEAWVRLGETWLYRDAEDAPASDWDRQHAEKALTYFEQALAIEPLHADAWGGKARALVVLGRYEETLAAVDAGIAALPLGVEYCWIPLASPFIHRELLVPAIKALVFLGRRDEARRVLEAALACYPGQTYLEDRQELLDMA